MLKTISFLLLCLITISANAASLPKHITTSYTVTQNGEPFANVHEEFVLSNASYTVTSVTKGIGIYGLFGLRKLTSAGGVTSVGLQPKHFELQQGDNPKKALLADFDWANKTLHMLVKGEAKDAVLTNGTQDLASYAYQFMFLAKPYKDTISVTLTTGKKLNQYDYKVVEEPLVIASKSYKTLHLVQVNQKSADTKELWLSVDYHYLPIQILMVDGSGQKFAQTLTEFHED